MVDQRPPDAPAPGPRPAPAAAAASGRTELVSEIFLQEQFAEVGWRKNWPFWLVAAIVHLVIFMVTFPDINFRPPNVTSTRKVLTVRKYTPPPPKQQPKKKIEKKITKKVPIPDPTPEEPEPIIEPEPPPEPEPLPDDVDVVLGDPEPPPMTGPLMPGIGGVTEPELIPETRVEPEYPEIARKARIEGKVILRAVIRKDGTVGNIEVLKAPPANLGFTEAAIAAVRQWRYRPALQNGRPVDVYFTVNVTFTLD